jgi:hypothetical protein
MYDDNQASRSTAFTVLDAHKNSSLRQGGAQNETRAWAIRSDRIRHQHSLDKQRAREIVLRRFFDRRHVRRSDALQSVQEL